LSVRFRDQFERLLPAASYFRFGSEADSRRTPHTPVPKTFSDAPNPGSPHTSTSGYRTKQERIAIAGVDDLVIHSLADRLQYSDPLGESDRMGISAAAWPLFGLLWPSGAHLAARLALRPVRASERILEVGCGLALASLVGHRRGADVTASDRHPLAESFLRENLRLNDLAPMKYRHGDWNGPALPPGRESPPALCVVSGQYDLIIGSDLLYERDANAALAGFIARHASPAAEVWIVDPDRGNRPAFNRQIADQGFLMREERLDTPASVGVAAYKGRLLVYRRAAC
jgi:predicted nicotinamide N-methyase